MERNGKKMENSTKVKQIVIRFNIPSYEKIRECAEIEHRGLGDFVRHAALDYIERVYQARDASGIDAAPREKK
ncbi:MAG: hypothetical protein FWH52_01840 [Synergistaceae bacterium]|nr:hypothetical protein [Synergistaceae bacterium]